MTFSLHRFRKVAAFSMAGLMTMLSAAHLNAQADPRDKPGLNVQCGDMVMTYTTEAGLTLAVHGMELIRGNSFYIMKPGWAGRIYGLSDSPDVFQDAVIEEHDDGSKVITLNLEAPEDTPNPFSGTMVLTMTPDNALAYDVTYTLEEGTDAIFEFGVAQFSAGPLIGSSYEGTTWDGETVSGTIPVEAPSAEYDESTIANAIMLLAINSRVGPIVLEANEAARVRLFDYRKNVWAMDGKPIFWFGQLAHPIPTGTEVNYKVRIDFPDELTPVSTTVESVAEEAGISETETALVPVENNRPLIPTPKEVLRTETRFPLTPETRIYVGEEPSTETDRAVAFLMRDLREKYGLYPEIIRKQPPAEMPEGVILIGEGSHLPEAADALEERGLSLPEEDEGYALYAGQDVVMISAETGQGVFHGVTTLAQLIAPSREGAVIRGAEIRDWPSLSFRGVHALSGKDRGGEIAKAVRDLLARYKMNIFVWETEYIIWDSHPDIAHPEYGMTKTDAAQVVQAAKQNLVEMVPLIQSLGHSEYIFIHGHNLEIAEDPETPYAYSPENPDTYAFIFDLYEEALEFFDHPEWFHIGHDEVTMRGRFPYRSRESGKDAYTLVMEDIWRLHDWFAERDVRMMMWSDMFLAEGDAPDAAHASSQEISRSLRDQLPDDVMINDWHYAAIPPEELTSLALWRDEGFAVTGASWYNPINIRSQALASIEAGVAGILQTTWAGFNFRIANNEPSWFQYWVYILAAHYAWSGDTTMPEDLPWQAREVFLDTWFGGRPLMTERDGFHVDLSPVANRSLTDASGSGLLGYGAALDLSGLDPGQTRFGETAFRISENANGDAGLMLSGRLNPEGEFPERVVLTLEEPQAASEMRFLMASAFAAPERADSGEIEVTYTSGRSETLPLLFGVNLFSLSQDRVGRDARIAWTGETASGDGVRLWTLTWPLEHGGEIESIAFESRGTEAAPMIFAVTGVR